MTRGQQLARFGLLINGVLALEQLKYADEVRSPTEVTVPTGEVKPAELALAKQLIQQLVNESFEPQKYKDTVRERVLEAIQRKVEGQDITTDVQPDSSGKILDLMEALKASLKKAKSEDKEDARAAS